MKPIALSLILLLSFQGCRGEDTASSSPGDQRDAEAPAPAWQPSPPDIIDEDD